MIKILVPNAGTGQKLDPAITNKSLHGSEDPGQPN